MKQVEKSLIQKYLKEYKDKIFSNNFKLYGYYPLNRKDTLKCGIYNKNIPYLKNVVFQNALKNLGYDINENFGVGDQTKIEHLPKHVPTRDKQQSYPFPLNNDFRQQLLYSVKFKIHQEECIGTMNNLSTPINYRSVAEYYVTEIKHRGRKQPVVLKVTTDYINPKGNDLLSPYDFSNVNIQALLGKKCKKIMSLARLDYNKSSLCHPHQNFLDKDENPLKFGTANWKKNQIVGTHLHIQSEKFELLNPFSLGSGTAVKIDDEDKNFLQLRKELLKKFNFVDIKTDIDNNLTIEEIYRNIKAKFNVEGNKNVRTN